MKTVSKLKIKLLPLFFLLITSSFGFCQTTEILGATIKGGSDDLGLIFKTDANGNNYSIVHEFKKVEGFSPEYSNLCEADNGLLYGMTTKGGVNELGILFEYNPETEILTKKIDFNGVSNGSYPYGSLTKASNGKLYGTTLDGGTNGTGTLFEYDSATNSFTKIHDFGGLNPNTTGALPRGNVIQATNGKLYGMTPFGGIEGWGNIYEFDISTNTFTSLFNFTEQTQGYRPYGDLIQTPDGMLYGFTFIGGVSTSTNSGLAHGVIFKFDITTNDYSVVHHLADAIEGANPNGSLMQAANGKLYGMTSRGGVSGDGVIFDFDITTNTYSKRYNFDTLTGEKPQGNLIQVGNKLYGLTQGGGASRENVNAFGTLFEFDPNNYSFVNKASFHAGVTGIEPLGSLMLASNGKLYGTTSKYAITGNDILNGTLFEYDITQNSLKPKLVFGAGQNGSVPIGNLIKASDCKLYGITQRGGNYHRGVLFEYDPATNVYTKKIDFDHFSIGSSPETGLTLASNGKVYGAASDSGNSLGLLFEYDINSNSISVIKNFTTSNSSEGRNPLGPLIELNEKLYGVTQSGGANQTGVIFEYNLSTGEYNKIYDFDPVNSNNGNYPVEGLSIGANNNIYGVTSSGGISNFGVIFQFNPNTNTYSKKIDFDDSIDGIQPFSGLHLASDNNFYGVTFAGGTNSKGVIYQYNQFTNTYTKLYDFDGVSGSNPIFRLTENNNKLYGITFSGGTNNFGTLIEYDLDTNNTNPFTKKLDFNGINGNIPSFLSLYDCISLTNTELDYKNISIYPNPTSEYIQIQTIIPINNIELYNLLGNRVLKTTNSKINVSTLQPGIYLLKIFLGNNQITKKIVIN